jgi:deoxyribodipyrimidine photo-lyase
MKTLVWFRNDLRVADNPALYDACRAGQAVGCFLVADEQWYEHDEGPRRVAFVYQNVLALAAELAKLGIPFEVVRAPRFADAAPALARLADQLGATHLTFNDEYPLNEQRRDAAVVAAMEARGIAVERFHGGVSLPPGSVLTRQGSPYTVFTPFKKRWLELNDVAQVAPLPRPASQGEPLWVKTITPFGDVSESLADWPAGEREARRRLDSFVTGAGTSYGERRDVPSVPGTSKLSAYLSAGVISVNQCLHAAAAVNGHRLSGGEFDPWISELIWREFYRHVVAQFPHVSRGLAFKRELDRIEWRDDPEALAAWQQGRTGYPLVDAAMRQLNSTGWMHNRLRMVTAMFLSKHLFLDWRLGERYFMQQLVDGDFAANNGGWQWSASTGTDAAPYFRIFNPATQGERFDPDGAFTRAMLPVLADVPKRHLFRPHDSGMDLDYPRPIVDHAFARDRAIAAFKR